MSRPGERRKFRRFRAEFIGLFLIGCATVSPFNEAIRGRVDPAFTPARVLVDHAHGKGREVLWGGTILASRNLADSTEIQVLAYPIDHAGKPRIKDDAALGRFIVVQKGYLETARYAPGRAITVHGRVVGIQDVTVGAFSYRQPLVDSMQLHLWRPASRGGPVFRFGFGFASGF
jgi:outer membrane lipoprotein